MRFFKRIFLFLLLNAVVVFTISILLNLLNIRPYLSGMGLNYKDLALFCLIWGMVGALLSLFLSRIMAKDMLSIQVIDPKTHDPILRNLIDVVQKSCRKAGLETMPQVGIYVSSEINAFATGPSAKRSLVAVSSGLLQKLKEEELEGVIGHEVAHIANGDMVTMTLLQGVVNAFVMFLARVLASILTGMGRQNSGRSSSPMAYYALVWVFEAVFMILGLLVITAFSRYREFRADQGGATIAGRMKMIAALQALQRSLEKSDPAKDKPALAAFKITNRNKKGGLLRLFATHPSLEERIERLKTPSAT